jgi:hypothetical protein
MKSKISRASDLEESHEGQDDGVPERTGRRAVDLRLFTQQGGHHSGRHEEREEEIGLIPAVIDGEFECPGRAENHSYPVARDEHRRTEAQLSVRKRIPSKSIGHHILRRAEEGEADGRDDDELRVLTRREEVEAPQRQTGQGLRDEQPSSASSEIGNDEAIEDGRPQEFQRIRNSDEREETDLVECDLLGQHPELQRRAGGDERKAGGEPQHQQGQHSEGKDQPPGRVRAHLP